MHFIVLYIYTYDIFLWHIKHNKCKLKKSSKCEKNNYRTFLHITFLHNYVKIRSKVAHYNWKRFHRLVFDRGDNRGNHLIVKFYSEQIPQYPPQVLTFPDSYLWVDFLTYSSVNVSRLLPVGGLSYLLRC